MKNLSFVVAAHDGITSHHCGVGTMVQEYIRALDLVARNSPIDIRISIFAITPQFDRKCDSYNKTIRDEISAYCSNSGGELIEVPYDEPFARYPPEHTWELLCDEAFKAVKLVITPKCDRVVGFYHDCPFGGMLRYFDGDTKHLSFWIPHSSSFTNDLYQINPTQPIFERKLLKNIEQSNNQVTICISTFFRTHLMNCYGIGKENTTVLLNGSASITPILNKINSAKFDLKPRKRSRNPFLLVYSRAVPYKNIIEALEATTIVQTSIPRLRIVLLSPADRPGDKYDSIVDHLIEKSKQITRIKTFTSGLVHSYINDPDCLSCISLSVNEPFGLMPLEARLFGSIHGAVPVVPSQGGLAEQVTHAIDGFVSDASRLVESTAKNLMHIAELSPNIILKTNIAGMTRVLKQHWLTKNLADVLSHHSTDFTFLSSLNLFLSSEANAIQARINEKIEQYLK